MPAQDIRLFDDGLVGSGVLEPREAGGFALGAANLSTTALCISSTFPVRSSLLVLPFGLKEHYNAATTGSHQHTVFPTRVPE